MNYILLGVGIIFLVGFIIGYKRGFVKIVTSLVVTIATIFVVVLISPAISKFLLTNTSIEKTVQKRCEKMFAGEAAQELSRDEEIVLLEKAEMPELIRNMLIDNNNKEVKHDLGAVTFQDYVAKYLSKIVADILAFLIAFIVISIVARILMHMFDILAKLPVVGGVNRFLGGVTGMAFSLLVVWIVFVAITLLYQTEFSVMCFQYIEKSKYLQWLYDNNVLMKFIVKH